MQRYVLLGASNLRMGLPLVLENIRNLSRGEAEVLVASGFGRSYGQWSRFLFRALPGIVDCGLWDSFNGWETGNQPVRALITDVGNDLLYGNSPEQITDWVGNCLTRLQRVASDVVITLPPLDSVKTLSRLRYGLARTLLFPKCRTPLSEMSRLAEELTQRLDELARRFGFQALELPGEWYGLDPVHYRRSQRSRAWRTALCGWRGVDAGDWLTCPSGEIKRAVRNGVPAMFRKRGRQLTGPQPTIQIGEFRTSMY